MTEGFVLHAAANLIQPRVGQLDLNGSATWTASGSIIVRRKMSPNSCSATIASKFSPVTRSHDCDWRRRRGHRVAMSSTVRRAVRIRTNRIRSGPERWLSQVVSKHGVSRRFELPVFVLRPITGNSPDLIIEIPHP